MRSYSDNSIRRDEYARKKAQLWAPYDRCGFCGAAPGLPCRDGGPQGGRPTTKNKPCVNRALKPEA